VLMALPPVTHERRFGLGHPPLLPIFMSWFPLAENQRTQTILNSKSTLEIELIDIVLVKNKGRSQQELTAVDQFEFP
jgi:hypothetical protein